MSINYTSEIRKVGNCKVVTLPEEVIQALSIDVGQNIIFNIENGKVVIEAVNTLDEERNILSIVRNVSRQYDQALKKLVDR
ncbi:AbrB/MazE/SpoVT family DNA-binding domain-containing protein [Mammaliicoccus sciuri]|uniref:AbrB/MazE/SpoVT family DNA-binding domain-containing protein n=1 Tax=Mammaliicoccus sciuri TaxID=1296 RepID=UPI0008F6802C|nr:hypothetical protein [Mammaliicoccus sciuri]RIN84024.1 hypothetical protein BU004_11445 [Mammaliicoccus sciuri]SFV45384.1 Hypothetical protein SSCIU_02225 [Mammaliicoccus sciuri]